MRTFKPIVMAGLVLLATAGAAQAQGGFVVRQTVNLDYYLLNYYNRLAALPRTVNGAFINHYSWVNLWAPGFFYLNHDFDFQSGERTPRSDGMGGTGQAFIQGAGAMGMNPAGVARGRVNQVFVGAASRFGSGPSAVTDELTIETGFVGAITPTASEVQNRMQLAQGGVYISGRPFYNPDHDKFIRGFIGSTTLGLGYRRYLETYNGTNQVTDMLTEGGLEGLSAAIRTAGQSREKGGVDAVTLTGALGFGKEESFLSLYGGATANVISGRIRADQVWTATEGTQIRLQTPGGLLSGDFIEQKYTGEAYDLGVQGSLFGNLLQFGGTYRPEYTLRMRNGKYQHAEAQVLTGQVFVTFVNDGTIADHDVQLPASYKVGGALRFEQLLGDGANSRGLLGFFHRFIGRGMISADYNLNELSKATIEQKADSLRNPDLADEFESVNLFLGQVFGPEYLLSTSMPLYNGSALLTDKESYHFGFETPLVDKSWRLDLRLGYESFPLAFPTLVLDDERVNENGISERPIRRHANGTPVTESVDGNAISLGFGYSAGQVSFDLSFRSLKYEYITWWGAAQPKYWYNPLTGEYTSILDDLDALPPGTTAAQFDAGLQVSQTANTLRLSAELAF